MPFKPPKFDAAAFLDHVLEAIDPKHHASIGVVEAHRRVFDAGLSDTENQARGQALDKEIIRRFGQQDLPSHMTVPKPQPKIQPASEAEFLDGLYLTIGDIFSTTVDGSEERANYLAARAEQSCKRAVEQSRFGWLAQRRLRKAYQKMIANQRQNLLF
ncbi:MAG: hypothetical protein AAF198_06930 [Pseudomonadota bacterium]